jgi:predicted small secreted protein
MPRTFRVLAAAALLASLLPLAACNTTAGFGKDVQSTGTAVTHGAKDVQQKM